MTRRVAITGLGAIASTGADVASVWDAARAGRSGIGPLRTLPTERLTVRIGAEILGFDPAAHFDPRQLTLLDRGTQLALVATRQALGTGPTGTSLSHLDPSRVAVIMSAAGGQITADNGYRALYAEGANRLHPFTVPRIMPSASASHVSMIHGLTGPTFSIASACASGSHAIGVAFQMVRAGLVDAAVAGGGDASFCFGYLKAWDALRVLSPDVCRPFSKGRTGLVLGEAAGTLVLEDWDHAVARGATIHGELAGFGMTADAGDITAPSPQGAARAMAAAIKDAGRTPAEIGYVNAHGTGTRLNDSSESQALRHVFGDALPPTSSTKSMHGHCLNSAGAIEAVLTVLALRDRVLPPTIGFLEPDPECPVDCIPNVAREADARLALSNSFAFGGLNAVLAIASPS